MEYESVLQSDIRIPRPQTTTILRVLLKEADNIQKQLEV